MALSPQQYNEIMRDYERTRLKNRDLHQKRLSEIYSHIPAFQDLDGKIASCSVAAGKARLRGSSDAMEKLRTQLASLSDEKKKLLKAYGYPENYLEPIYQCPLCHDTGYVEEGKCRCLQQKIVDLIYAQSSIREELEKENFSHFRYDYYPEQAKDGNPSPRANIKAVVSRCQDFVSHFPEKDRENILFLGNTGVGKTFLSHCIAYELIKKAYTVLYLTSFQLFDSLEQYAFHREKQTGAPPMPHLLDCDLLIIDDLGTELNNSFVSSQLFLCINERLLRHKATIISTNLSLEQLSRAYSERVLSRIMENYQILSIYGQDIRLLKALGNVQDISY